MLKTNVNVPSALRHQAIGSGHGKGRAMAEDTTKCSEVVYLKVSIKLRRGTLAAFQNYVNSHMYAFYNRMNWILVNATYNITGNLDGVEHIWRIPPGEDVVSISRAWELSTNNVEFQVYNELVESTTQELTSGMEYDPLVFGYQHYTIVLDTVRAGWILNNDELAPYLVQIKDQQNAEMLLSLLDEGATAASVSQSESEFNRNLLFNLAEMQPKTTFQWPNGNVVADSEQSDNYDKAPKFPEGVGSIYIVGPLGHTYEFTAKQLREAGEPMSPADVEKDRRISRLLENDVPVASIPEKQPFCAPGLLCWTCYVINLNTFDN